MSKWYRCDYWTRPKLLTDKDVIHRYLDKLKEAGLIDHYGINTVYTDDKPYCTNITLHRGEYIYSRSFNDLNDKNMVIEILADCVIKLYRGMANYLMEQIKEEKHDKRTDT